VIFVDNYARMLNIMRNAGTECPHLRCVVHFDKFDAEQMKSLRALKAEGVEMYHYSELLASGQSNLVTPQPPKPSDTATICYTSGTTGMPKGKSP
jgi:long-chain acyl-CoA synthetase